MIEATKIKFEQSKNYVTETLKVASLSKTIINSMEMETSLKRLEDGVFRIAVVAPFSAGKSTFINSLLEFDLLSTSILVETAAITTVKYGEQPKAVINYRDGSKVVIGENDNKIDPLTLKTEIKKYTAVNRENSGISVEKEIENVDIYWPIDLCKNGVEIVDTPGLFAQYEAHSNITSGILNSVNAVIFIIDPTTVGEINFMKVIREYVDNAKKTTIDNTDKHIFFAVNKIDQYPEGEVIKANEELQKVLSGIVTAPRIFNVSSYFGIKTAMYENGHITLDEIRRDETIKFLDEDHFPVAGRAIQHDDMRKIRKISNIQAVTASLGMYFEEKNAYLIDDVFRKLVRALEIEMEQLQQEIVILENSHNMDSKILNKKASNLKKVFNEEINKLQRSIRHLVEMQIDDSSNVQSSTAMSKIRNRADKKIPIEASDWVDDVKVDWRQYKRKIQKYNAEDIINEFFKMVDLKIENSKKLSNQQTFDIIQKEISYLLTQCEILITDMESKFNNIFENEFNLVITQSSFFDFKELVMELQLEIEQAFKGNSALELSNMMEDSMKDHKQRFTSIERVPGFTNWLKGFFGRAKTESKFDLEGFVENLNKQIIIGIEELEEDLMTSLRRMSQTAYNQMPEIVESIINQHLLEKRLKNYETWQKEQLEGLSAQKQQTEEEYRQTISTNNYRLQLLTDLKRDSNKEYQDIINSQKIIEMEMA